MFMESKTCGRYRVKVLPRKGVCSVRAKNQDPHTSPTDTFALRVLPEYQNIPDPATALQDLGYGVHETRIRAYV